MNWDQYQPERYPTPDSVFDRWDRVRQQTLDFETAIGPAGTGAEV